MFTALKNVGIALLAGALLTLTAWSAQAEPHFYIGQTTKISSTVLCDNQEQVDSIAAAQQESWESAIVVYRGWYLTRNDLQQPSCYAMQDGQWIEATLVAQVNTFADAHTHTGEQVTLYTFAVLWKDRKENEYTGYIISLYPLHDEPTADQLKPSAFEMDA